MAGAIDEFGISVGSDEAPSACLVAVPLPDGGHAWFDGFSPDRLCRLHVPADGASDPSLVALAERLEAGSAASVPTSWARLGVVTAVDRWCTNVLDEQLLIADLALARHEVGHGDEAATLFARSAPYLTGLPDRSASGRAGSIPELRRVLEAGAVHVPGLALVLARLPEADPAGDDRTRIAMGSSAQTLWRGGHTATDVAADELREMFERTATPPVVLLHPADVPARVVTGRSEVTELPDGGFRIDLEAFASLTPDEPAARRLVARVLGAEDRLPDVVTLRHDGVGGFTTEVNVRSTGAAATVQVVDALLAPPSRSGANAVADAQRVSAVQRQFSRARISRARGTVPVRALSGTGATPEPEELVRRWEGEATRPLLAELLAP